MKDLKQTLLDVGFDLISEQGFASLGLMSIINAANATKGSFYHHFKSKEYFGTVLLNNYYDEHLATLERFLTDPELSYKARVHAYFQYWTDEKLTEDFRIKCLIVKLSGEVSGGSTHMQAVLSDGAEKVITRMGDFFSEGTSLGHFHISNGYDAARSIFSLWLGSTLLAAIQRDRGFLNVAMEKTLEVME
ncbi:TetR/AcrR family transcriptional regulator [Enterovibrio calviensis]|uniref:TetR/AcrR family transcriptional regulator n=1 Tax=Enterovibrio calviensis TaxID=91359 RepID=UPI000489BDFF|nr:TetR/AcrR family transcriptional regulator [Enterovibrio calviensis]